MDQQIGEIIFWGAALVLVIFALARSERRVDAVDKMIAGRQSGVHRGSTEEGFGLDRQRSDTLVRPVAG